MHSSTLEIPLKRLEYAYDREAIFREESGQVVATFLKKAAQKEIGRLAASTILVDIECRASKKVNDKFFNIRDRDPRTLSSFPFAIQKKIIETLLYNSSTHPSANYYRWVAVETERPDPMNEIVKGLMITDPREYEMHSYFTDSISCELQPPASHELHASSSCETQPCTIEELPTSTSSDSQPSTSYALQPPTSHELHASSSYEVQPCTSEELPTSTSSDSQPSTSYELEPLPPTSEEIDSEHISSVIYDTYRSVAFYQAGGYVSASFFKTGPGAPKEIGRLSAQQIQVDVDSAAAKVNCEFLRIDPRPSMPLSSFSSKIQTSLIFSVKEKQKGDRWLVVSEQQEGVTGMLVVDTRKHERH